MGIASQNDKIASRIDKIASLSGKIDIMREDMILSEQRETMQDNLLKSKIDETAAAVEEMKNTPKAVVAFRVTCAKNFPWGISMYRSDKQVIWQNIEYNIGSVRCIKWKIHLSIRRNLFILCNFADIW